MKLLIAILLAAFSFPATAADYSIFNTARASVQVYAKACLADQAGCQITDSEKSLITGIVFDMQNEGALNFISARQNPGRFESAGTHRIAATTLHRGDPIYINVDELDSIDYAGAVAILTHEFGHHEGVTDTDDRVLDVLGSKVREFMLGHAEVSGLSEYNQPRSGMFIFNAPGERVSGATSQVFVYDAHGITSVDAQLDRDFSCPVGLTRQGGIYVSQLRSEGPFDWDAPAQTQDFGLRAQAQVLCMGGPKPEVIFYTIRFSVPMAPDAGPSSPDWWKTKTGHLLPSPEISIFDRGFVDYERIFQVGSGLPLKVLKVDNPKPVLIGGEAWAITATVESPAPLTFQTCRADFTSKAFINLGYKPRTTLDFTSCQFKSLGANRYEVQASFTFPKTTEARDYYLYSIELKLAGQDYALLGVPVFPVQVKVQSQANLSPLKVAIVALAQQGADGKGGFIDQNIDLKKSHVYQVSNSSLFAFQIMMNSTSPILESSGISLDVNAVEGQKEIAANFFIPLRDSFKYGWGIPLNGGTQIQPYPGMPGKYVLSLSLRGHAPTGAASVRTMRSVETHFIYLINESLQEDFEYVPVQVNGI